MTTQEYVVERAMRLAAEYHTGQVRKGSQLPYITHPASVAIILATHGITDDDILASAWLHDVLEDTDCIEETLLDEFPAQVVKWVSDLSEVKSDDAGHKRPWIDRKTDHIEVIRKAEWQSRSIVLADKIHNADSILLDVEIGQNPWTKFNATPSQVLWYYREMHKVAFQNEPHLKSLSTKLEQRIQRLEQTIPRRSSQR